MTAESSVPSPAGIRYCLALSGGGYRAALFHLGALRRLNELGLLSRLTHVSSVSGGSIIAAHLAINIRPWPAPGTVIPEAEWERIVAQPLRALCSQNIRTRPIVRRFFSPGGWFKSDAAVRALADQYDRYLTRGATLSTLPRQPRFEINATELIYGVRFSFEATRLGCYRAGYLTDAGNWSLALAVAASSCFPPIFRPLKLRLKPEQLRLGTHRDLKERARMVPRLSLSDGGVYDNLGVEPLWHNSTRFSRTFLLVSDGGMTLRYQEPPSFFGIYQRFIGIPLNQVGYLRKRWIRDRTLNPRDPLSGIVWGIETDTATSLGGEGYCAALSQRIARIRTDLDAFSDGEMAILENQGYLASSIEIHKNLPELLPRPTPRLSVPHRQFLDPLLASRKLKFSHRRVPIIGRFRWGTPRL